MAIVVPELPGDERGARAEVSDRPPHRLVLAADRGEHGLHVRRRQVRQQDLPGARRRRGGCGGGSRPALAAAPATGTSFRVLPRRAAGTAHPSSGRWIGRGTRTSCTRILVHSWRSPPLGVRPRLASPSKDKDAAGHRDHKTATSVTPRRSSNSCSLRLLAGCAPVRGLPAGVMAVTIPVRRDGEARAPRIVGTG